MTFRSIVVAVVLAASAFVAPRPAHADAFSYFKVTEDSTGVTYSVKLLGVDYGTTHQSGQNLSGPTSWFSGEYPQLLFPESFSFDLNTFGNGMNFMNWSEPDDPHTYNTLVISPSGNRGSTSFIMESDVPGINWNVQSGDYNPFGCTNSLNQPITCPVLPDGASYEIPLYTYEHGNSGSLTVSFTDLGDTASLGLPEPMTLALLGFGIAGLCVVRRRPAVSKLVPRQPRPRA